MKRGKWNRKAHNADSSPAIPAPPSSATGLGTVAERLLADARVAVPRSLAEPPMLCEQAMQHPVQTLLESDSLALAAERMRDTDVGFLPVCNTAGIAVGVITDRDLVIRALASQLPPSTPVSQVMTHEVVACRPKDSLVRAIGMMRERHLSRVLCVDGVGRPAGVITLSQVVRYEDSMRMAKTVREIVSRASTTTAA